MNTVIEAKFRTAGGVRGMLELQFPENIYVPLSQLETFDFAYAEAWCEQQLGAPRFRVLPRSMDFRTQAHLQVQTIASGGKWCYFVNTYYFGCARDAMLFRLSTQ